MSNNTFRIGCAYYLYDPKGFSLEPFCLTLSNIIMDSGGCIVVNDINSSGTVIDYYLMDGTRVRNACIMDYMLNRYFIFKLPAPCVLCRTAVPANVVFL